VRAAHLNCIRCGFINDHDLADMTLLPIVLSKVSSTRFREPSARGAHRRIAAFFRRHPAG
jgi:carboxymethylenebutenolidase